MSVYLNTKQPLMGIYFHEDEVNLLRKKYAIQDIYTCNSIEDLLNNNRFNELKVKKFYAIKCGRVRGILFSWDDCKNQVSNFSSAKYKSFLNLNDAVNYMDLNMDIRTKHPINIDNICVAYVDGSFNKTNQRYGYGVVLMYSGKEYEFFDSGNDLEMKSMRNVAGEILGAQRAIEEAVKLGAESIVVYYDYQGIEEWATGGWKRNKKGTIAYYNFIQEAEENIIVKFCKVKAHTGVELNERVDKLAKKAVGIFSVAYRK